MNLYIVKDKYAESEFGYKKVEHYQIIVKQSVFRKMLVAECKNPRNWLSMTSQLVGMIFNLLSTVLFTASSLTFIFLLFFFGVEPTEATRNATAIQLYQESWAIFKMIFVFCLILVLCIRGLKLYWQPTFFPAYFEQASNNAFTQQIFHKLTEQAMAIEAEKKNETV